jgi:tetratricopeptide (TPR) repeat protein
LLEAAAALCENRIPVAESVVARTSEAASHGRAGLRMLAEVGARLGRYADAECMLERCLELAPSFVAGAHNYALVLHRQRRRGGAGRRSTACSKPTRAIPAIDAEGCDSDRHRRIRAGDPAVCRTCSPSIRQRQVWMSYGHALKTAGRQASACSTYRKSIELAPQLGEAYWSLANLKTFSSRQPTSQRCAHRCSATI